MPGLRNLLNAAGNRITSLGAATADSDAAQFGQTMKLVKRQVLTSDSTAYSASGDTDMTVTGVPVVLGRVYPVHFHSQVTVNAAGTWRVILKVGGSDYDRIHHMVWGSSGVITISVWTEYVPTSTTTLTFTIALSEVAGTSTMTLNGAAAVRRRLSIYDGGVDNAV